MLQCVCACRTIPGAYFAVLCSNLVIVRKVRSLYVFRTDFYFTSMAYPQHLILVKRGMQYRLSLR